VANLVRRNKLDLITLFPALASMDADEEKYISSIKHPKYLSIFLCAIFANPGQSMTDC
jgi:hypothetical protein